MINLTAKKILCLILSLSILVSLCSCVDLSSENNNDYVVATNFPAYDFARSVCGDIYTVKMLLPTGSESHSYEPTAQDILNIQNCKLFIYTGGESDAWVETILSSLDKKVNTLKMTDCVSPLSTENKHSHDHSVDEHVWTSPVNAIKIIKCISDKLCAINNEKAAEFNTNAAEYIDAIENLHNDFSNFFATCNNKTLVFGDRFPFLYFATEYNLSHASAFPGCAHHSEPGAETIASLIEKINNEGIKTIYYIEFSDMKIANSLSAATGAKTALLHSCHNISKEQFDNGTTYLSLMQENLETLKKTMN